MKSFIKKSIIVLVIAVLLIALCSSNVFAESASYSDMISTINTKGDSSEASGKAQNIVGAILAIAKVIAVGVALIMLVVLAIKYMAASAGDKAEIKKHAVVYVTGALVLFGSAGILSIIEQFASKNIGDGSTEAAE